MRYFHQWSLGSSNKGLMLALSSAPCYNTGNKCQASVRGKICHLNSGLNGSKVLTSCSAFHSVGAPHRPWREGQLEASWVGLGELADPEPLTGDPWIQIPLILLEGGDLLSSEFATWTSSLELDELPLMTTDDWPVSKPIRGRLLQLWHHPRCHEHNGLPAEAGEIG